jgi:hypothetical protein
MKVSVFLVSFHCFSLQISYTFFFLGFGLFLFGLNDKYIQQPPMQQQQKLTIHVRGNTHATQSVFKPCVCVGVV